MLKAAKQTLFSAGYQVYRSRLGYWLTQRQSTTSCEKAPHSQTKVVDLNEASPGRFFLRVVPCLSDNYSYIFTDEQARVCIAVDVGCAASVLQECRAGGFENGPTHVLTTHGHWDHCAGNEEIAALPSHPNVYGPIADGVTAVSHDVTPGDKLCFGGFEIDVLGLKCHTKAHVGFAVKNTTQQSCSGQGSQAATGTGVLCSGDTLFYGGCGKFFEGDASDMKTALQKLHDLDQNYLLAPGHEYTMSNLVFIEQTFGSDSNLEAAKFRCVQQRERLEPTVPVTLAEDAAINPYMQAIASPMQLLERIKEASNLPEDFQDSVSPVQLIGHIRTAKDNFVPPQN